MSLVIGFPRLMTEVVKGDKCTLCGTCVGICPVRVVEIDENPKLVGRCIFCDLCYTFCPMVDDAEAAAEYRLLNPIFKNENIGGYMSAYSTRSKLKEVLSVAQDGGFVTSLLIHLLEKKVVDGVILTVVDKEWRPRPIVATTRAQVLDGAGSSYVVSPNLKVLNEAVVEQRLNKLAVVGTPCQINAMRKLQLNPQISGLGEEIYLTVGLFCTESFDYDVLRKRIEKNRVDIREVKKFAITKGKFIAESKDERILMDVPIKDMKGIARRSCHLCRDFTAEYADISVGSVGSPDGWSTVIIRSEKGSTVFSKLVKDRYIEAKLKEKIKSPVILSQKKKESAKA